MSPRRFPFWLTVFGTLAVSLLSTALVERFLDHRIAIIGAFAGLQRSFNAGIAFGMHFGMLQPLLIAVALLAVCWMAVKHADSLWDQVSYGLIVGGGVGNIIDRLLDGRVTDVFQVGSFPIFNVADSAITIGVLLLLIHMFFGSEFL